MKFARTMLLGCLLTATAAAQLQAVSGDDRPADRAAIRAHIESIFKAFIDHDGVALRATHAPQWRGFLEGSRTAIRGIDQYMNAVGGAAVSGPGGMKAYTILEFDVLFYGDVAVVPFVVEVESGMGDGPRTKGKLRILDVYAKLNGQWIQAGSHTDVHPETIAARQSTNVTLPEPVRQQLLQAREKVWRGYFENDRKELEALPPELVAIDAEPNPFSGRDQVLASAERFAQSGGKLKRLEFPHTDIQTYGNTAILYTTYEYEIENAGKSITSAGRATEMFVFRSGRWVNTGWHLDSMH
jgi:ketosteroid isomerase-like protein